MGSGIAQWRRLAATASWSPTAAPETLEQARAGSSGDRPRGRAGPPRGRRRARRCSSGSPGTGRRASTSFRHAPHHRAVVEDLGVSARLRRLEAEVADGCIRDHPPPFSSPRSPRLRRPSGVGMHLFKSGALLRCGDRARLPTGAGDVRHRPRQQRRLARRRSASDTPMLHVSSNGPPSRSRSDFRHRVAIKATIRRRSRESAPPTLSAGDRPIPGCSLAWTGVLPSGRGCRGRWRRSGAVVRPGTISPAQERRRIEECIPRPARRRQPPAIAGERRRC